MLGGVGVGFYDSSYAGLERYGSLNLTETSPPQSFGEPLTVEEVKSFLKIPLRSPPADDEDAELSSLISAARGQAEILQGRDLVRKQWDLSLDFWMEYHVRLRAPLASVDLVQLKDSKGIVSVLTEGVDYVVDTAKQPGILAPPFNGTWRAFVPWPSSAILIRYTSGFAPTSAWWQADGQVVKNGMRRLIADWFTNKLPFDKGLDPTREYPFAVTAALSQCALKIIG